ncbi:hypothetical protein GCM10010831_18930 [Psychroflexus salis]|uniref:Uncharacterized protein n=2 Tax=Psychroflexus salis TaxID=1526574 RepID=A0A917E9T1_9FLAO|nr:hypothetical protein GCM10010831_18930 [Psychroflexus salis]
MLALFLSNCASTKSKSSTSSSQNQEKDTIIIENDSLNYKLVILDYGFESWLKSKSQRNDYTQQYLEQKNENYVFEYNSRVRNSRGYDKNLYQFSIEYDPETDYGYDVNYMLYHYFLFFEEKYNQNLRR